MAWELQIHTLDVGQGESSLIILREPGPPERHLSMLIDGGKPAYTPTVHNKVVQLAKKADGTCGVDYILVSHYDDDHSGGIARLLNSDNLSIICNKLAKFAKPYTDDGNWNRPQIIARVTFAVIAAAWGALGLLNDKDVADLVNKGLTAAATVPNAATDKQAAEYGRQIAEMGENKGPYGGEDVVSLIPNSTRRRNAAKAAGVAAADASAANEPVEAAISASVFRKLPKISGGKEVFTNGIYAATRVIDIGEPPPPPDLYQAVLRGKARLKDESIDVPGLDRVSARTSVPLLGSRLFLWSPDGQPGYPVVNVVSRPKAGSGNVPNGEAWTGNGPALVVYGGVDNRVSIGILVRFNNFVFFTAGDLPYDGEDAVAKGVKAGATLPNAIGTPVAVPKSLSAFKCGHHGSDESTSEDFLKSAKPRAAVISCGKNAKSLDHPRQDVIDRLHAAARVQRFYLTNCYWQRNHVPATEGKDQLKTPGNKSRVAGDNAVKNDAPGRNRGDIGLRVTEEWSTKDPPWVEVTYWENTNLPHGSRTEMIK